MDNIIPLTYQVGVGGVGGFIAGYASKKLLKIVALIVGLFILALIYLVRISMNNYHKLRRT
jgi:uncharacterized membrane protein (Fun14 family)